MVTQWGMSELGPIQYESNDSPYLGRDFNKNKNFSDQVGYKIDQEVRKIIDYAEKRAVEIISKNRKLHKAIADALLKQETIVAEEIKYIEKHMKLPTKKVIKVTKEKSAQSLKSLISSVKKAPTSKKKIVRKQKSATKANDSKKANNK